MKMSTHFTTLPQRNVDASAADASEPGAASHAWKTLSVPGIMASAFGKLNLKRRAHILGLLLGSVGPLALAVIADGAYFKYFRYARSPEVPVSFEDAALASSTQVYDLVRYAEQSNPRLVDDLLAALMQDGMTMTAIGVSLATMAIIHFSNHRGVVSPPSARD
jgi:hypothetical protein